MIKTACSAAAVWDLISWPKRASFQERELLSLVTQGLPAPILSCFGGVNCNMF